MTGLKEIMTEHGSLTFAEISTRKWLSQHDEVIDQQVHYIAGFRAFDNPNQNCIMIFRRSVNDHGWPNPRSEYTITIACDEYGEEGYEETLKLGTSIHSAKREALRIVAEAITNGSKFFDIATYLA